MIKSIASSSRHAFAKKAARPPQQRQEVMTSALRFISEYKETTKENIAPSSSNYEIDDSDIDDSIGIFASASNGSLSALSAFPLPPTTTPKSLYQARSMTNMSSRYRQQITYEQQPIRDSQPLRERRCKKPLTINAPPPSSRMPIIRRTRSSSSMVYSPPPCPPPSTPLPEIPATLMNSLFPAQIAADFLDHSRSSDEVTRTSFDVDTSGEWMQKTDRSNSPTSSTASSNSTSPSSSRENSQRLYQDRKLLLSPLPVTGDDIHRQQQHNFKAWSQQLSLKLGDAFTHHLNSPNTFTTSTYTQVDDRPASPSCPSNQLVEYGFAM